EVHPIVTESAELAKQNGGKLHIVDVAPEFPWTVKLTMPDHEHIHDLVVKEKSESLEKIAAPLGETGLEVTTNVLEGKSSVEIIREVTRNGHDLVMRAAKGSDSRSSAFFGNTGSRSSDNVHAPYGWSQKTRNWISNISWLASIHPLTMRWIRN
ncbi:MAG: universal stress protein, partial [Planctomycetota bacterium]|nr:universal stress protein [Planctomycetota bacterium]